MASILIVDDEQNIRENVSEILDQNDYDCYTAHNPIEALEFLKSHKVEMIITDIRMPEMSGLEFYLKTRSDENLSSIPFIFMSAIITDKSLETGVRMGLVGFIKKPFKSTDLLNQVRTVLYKNAF